MIDWNLILHRDHLSQKNVTKPDTSGDNLAISLDQTKKGNLINAAGALSGAVSGAVSSAFSSIFG
jgi:hypothetical protein